MGVGGASFSLPLPLAQEPFGQLQCRSVFFAEVRDQGEVLRKRKACRTVLRATVSEARRGSKHDRYPCEEALAGLQSMDELVVGSEQLFRRERQSLRPASALHQWSTLRPEATEHERRATLNQGSVAVPGDSYRIFQRVVPGSLDRVGHCGQSARTLRKTCVRHPACRRR